MSRSVLTNMIMYQYGRSSNDHLGDMPRGYIDRTYRGVPVKVKFYKMRSTE